MIGIALRFPAGRFHTTPWGLHVNEGVPEWPPSPWRLLRSLVATWKAKVPQFEEAKVRVVLEQLATPPVFKLPSATTGHTRHYMPWHKGSGTTKVFDAFVCLDRDSEVRIAWPNAELDSSCGDFLKVLLENLNYLGRAESWCEALLLDAVDAEPNCWPLNGKSADAEQQLVRVLCTDIDTAFGNEHVTKTKTTGRGKSKQTVKESLYDPAWHLCIETAQLHAEKWSDPPGSRWITYVRRSDCFNPPPKPTARLLRPQHVMQVVRYALDSTVLPLVTETVPVAEAARRYLMGIYGCLTEQNAIRGRSRIFSGKDENGDPLPTHGHAYYLPTDEDDDGRLDHLTVVARDGFGSVECRAIDKLQTLKTGRAGEERHPLRVLLLGMGTIEDYRPLPLRESNVWISATPYIATKHAKTRGRQRVDLRSLDARTAFLIADLRSQLERAYPATAVENADISPLLNGQAFQVAGRWRPIQFKRFRQKKGDDGGRRLAGAFQITFAEPVPGPLAIGYSSHFGLGLFLPEKS